MSFEALLTTEFDTYRLEAIGTTNKKDYQLNLSSQMGMLQPYQDKEIISNDRVGQMFRLFTTRIDLKTADRVVVLGENYTVKSIKDFNFGSSPHFEALLAKQ